jgi:putative transposase
MMFKSFKYRLYPNQEQQVLMSKHFGCVRFIFNWALAIKIETYENEKKNVSLFDLCKKLPELKQEYEWLNDVNAQSLQSALRNLDSAYTNFFKKKSGFPKFKSKKRRDDSFQCPQRGKVNFDAGTISIPHIKNIKAVIDRRFDGKIKTVTISRTPSGKYYASVLVEMGCELPQKPSIQENRTIGIDVGLKTYATLSTGEKIANPKCLKKSQEKLKYEQHRLSKMQKDGKNREKQRRKVARLYERVTNQRNDFLHKLTHRLTHDNQVDTLVVEDLSVKNMMKNHCLAGSIGDAAWGRFFRFLRYKCDWYGKNLLQIGRFEPSSKICSCGVINESLTLADRTWTCEACGVTHDRDILAANNIKRFGLLKRTKIGQ